MEAQNAVNLKPRTIVELFDTAIRLYRNNFLKFVGIVAIALVPVQVIELLLNFLANQQATSVVNSSGVPVVNTSAVLGTFGISLIIELLTLLLVNGVANAALTSAISSSYLGEKITIGSAYSKIGKSWLPLFGAMLLVVLLVIVFGLWTIIPCAGWFTGVGIIFFLSLVVSSLVAPVIVIEKRSGGNAIRRAWDLARRRFWFLVGYFILIFAFNLLVIQGPVLLIGSAVQNFLSHAVASTQLFSSVILTLMANAILTLLLSLIYIPLQSTCATLVYFDLRIRQEGFDLAMMANQTAESPVDAVDLAGQTSAQANGKLVTWKEMGFFAAISLVTMGLYFIIIFAIAGSQLLRM